MPAVLRVALPVPLLTLFDYLPPAAGDARTGCRVLVPFGRGRQVGVVVAVEAETTLGGNRLKQVIRLLDERPLLDAELMQNRPVEPVKGPQPCDIVRCRLARDHHRNWITRDDTQQHKNNDDHPDQSG